MSDAVVASHGVSLGYTWAGEGRVWRGQWRQSGGESGEALVTPGQRDSSIEVERSDARNTLWLVKFEFSISSTRPSPIGLS